jgi:hypothetical protein
MTNEEIIEQTAKQTGVVVFAAFCRELTDMMNLARADEREKMQGVEVWVSWDEDKHTMLSLSVPVLSIDKPEYNNHSIVGKNYRYNDNDDYSAGLTREIAKHLNIQQGQCKKFRIVEVGNE